MKNGSDASRTTERDARAEEGRKEPTEQQKRAPAGITPALAMLQNGKAFADIIGILMLSPSHRHLFLSDLEWMVLPPLAFRQFQLFHDGKQPRAFAVWAKLSEDVEKDYLARGGRLRPAEWRSGDQLWLIDLVGPPSGKPELYKQLIAKLVNGPFEGREFKMQVLDPKTGKRRVMMFGAKPAQKDLEEAADGKAAEVM